ncbi:hypothetical protein RHMOL_Rhmol06G0300500 [Rhododendron molle]|uniref:Uncharacterized protein n=1 Tax=Rhododendron molle TaxID=49168 RepID=A0ACC0NIM8_RHOML|nr:hypothetical protein RHMOL_Rhmol06G0300500 [Rhododendron molle]
MIHVCCEIRPAMLGIVRRRVSSGGSSSLILGQSFGGVRPAVSTPRIFATSGDEVLHNSRGFGNVRNLCHLIFPGYSPSLRAISGFTASIRPEATLLQYRLFSSDNGDLVDAVVPFMGESISDGTLAKFLKKQILVTESKLMNQLLKLKQIRHVTIDVASPEAGVIQEYVAKEGDTVEPGTKIAVISKSAEGVTHVSPSEKTSEKADSKPPPPTEKSKEDKQKPKVESTPVIEKPKTTSGPPPPKRSATEPQLPPKERERRVPMTRLRKRVATRLKDSQNTFALLTTFNEVDIVVVVELSGGGGVVLVGLLGGGGGGGVGGDGVVVEVVVKVEVVVVASWWK